MPLCRGGAPIWGINKSRVPGPVLGHRLHINCLELKAVMAGLHNWVSVLQGHQVLIATDNTTVVSYINKQGGTYSLTSLRLLVDLFMWSPAQDIVLRARHIPCRLFARDSGPPIQKQSADIDRVKSPIRNCELNFRALRNSCSGHICHSPQYPTTQFMSLIPQPLALAVDALSQDWKWRSM